MKTFKFLLLIALLPLLTTCDKEKVTLQTMDGKWRVNKLHVYDSQGFKSIVEPEGHVTFHTDPKMGKTGTYEMDFSYITEGMDTFYIQVQGTLTQKDKTDFRFTRTVGDDYKATIPYHAKKDMEFHIPNLDQTGYNFYLKK